MVPLEKLVRLKHTCLVTWPSATAGLMCSIKPSWWVSITPVYWWTRGSHSCSCCTLKTIPLAQCCLLGMKFSCQRLLVPYRFHTLYPRKLKIKKGKKYGFSLPFTLQQFYVRSDCLSGLIIISQQDFWRHFFKIKIWIFFLSHYTKFSLSS